MAVFARDDSASTFQLPARPVPISSAAVRTAKPVHRRTSSREEQAARIGVGMQYTILRDPPWAAAAGDGAAVSSKTKKKKNQRMSEASSVYSDDMTLRQDMPQPLSFNKRNPPNPTSRLIPDAGPTMRSSRLPIFQQVRHMLHKPPPIHTDTTQVKWDECSGEMDDNGQPTLVIPSTYIEPFGDFMESGNGYDPLRNKRDPKRDLSPVSMLNEHDLALNRADDNYTVSPVSPLSRSSSFDEKPPSPGLHYPKTRPAQYLSPPSTHRQPIRRKPVVATLTPIVSAAPSLDTSRPRSPSDGRIDYHRVEEMDFSRSSRFSWTAYTNSIMTDRPPTAEITPSMPQRGFDSPHQDSPFSWTSNSPYRSRHAASPALNPPAIPPKTADYTPSTRIDSARGPPVQSILSRSRPVQRAEMEEPIPAMRIKTSLEPGSTSILKTHMPRASVDEPVQVGSGKKLPLPPELAAPQSHMTHLENLNAQERDLERQRRNTFKAIAELEKLQRASPIDVPFAAVRDAKKRLEEHRLRLSEVERDIREVGIAISRLRRKDGQENGLWVRRVTG